MFIVAPQDEANGEPVLTVARAKEELKKWQLLMQLRPNAKHAINLACSYYTLRQGDLALEAINAVFDSFDGDTPAELKATCYQNRGMIYRGFGRIKEAQNDIFNAWELNKHSAYIGMAQAEEHLRNGNWSEGWKWHNRVRGTCDGAALACGLPESCRFWDGLDNPTHLLVINEGGTGDRINYTRYLDLLTKKGINWSFFCFDELAPFYGRLPWIGRERLILEKDKTEFSPPPSHWVTTFSLAGPLGITPATIPGYPTPYTPPENTFKLNNPDGLPVVGLNWAARELFQGDLKVRSLTEGQAMRLVCCTADKVHWLNLQHDHKMPYPVINVPFESWEDLSVVMNACSAVVTVDSGPLWLSLAMEKTTAVVLTSFEDWKFSHNWGPKLTKYHNGPSQSLFDAEHAIDQLIFDIRKGNWPNEKVSSSHFSTASS